MEYTGRGKELLFGFLFALTVLVPVFFVYFLAGLALSFTKFLPICRFTLFFTCSANSPSTEHAVIA